MSDSKPKIVFMGTPEFAVPTMVKLFEELGLEAVVTVPDKPKGRGKNMLPSPVKNKAKELGIKVFQPEKLNEINFINEMTLLKPDIFVVLAFRILPEELFTIPKIASFNIHASLLPKYRGAAPINWAIINGEKFTGLTSFILRKQVDTGDMIMQRSVEIIGEMTAGDLHDLMMPIASEMAVDTCRMLLSGEYNTSRQDTSLATPAPKIFRENCEIKWNMHSRDLKNFIHGVSPVPGAWTNWNGKILKIHRVEFNSCGTGTPGEYIISDNTFQVWCGKGILTLREIQPEGKKSMNINDFLRGYRGEKNGRFD